MAYCAAKFGIQTGAGKVSGNIPVIGGALKADEALANFAAGFNKTIAYVFQHPWVLIVAIAALFLLIASAKGLVTGS